MRKCIAALCELGQIDPIIDSGWLFKAPLAPEPHQEHIVGICDLVWRFCQLYSTECCDTIVWRFCVNYIPLNTVTRVIASPIPRCDDAVKIAFGNGFSKCF